MESYGLLMEMEWKAAVSLFPRRCSWSCRLKARLRPEEKNVPTGKKSFQITAYDNQLQNETYQADIALYWKNDTERKKSGL